MDAQWCSDCKFHPADGVMGGYDMDLEVWVELPMCYNCAVQNAANNNTTLDALQDGTGPVNPEIDDTLL